MRLKIKRTDWMACLMIVLVTYTAGCRSRYDTSDNTSNRPKKENLEVNKLIDQAYDLKQEGKNGEALAIFRSLRPKVAAFFGKESEEMASLLDDEGSCYLRGGDYETAKQRYEQAIQMLKKRRLSQTRLFASIHRRLKTIAAFEELNIACHEPLTVSNPQDDKNDIPYFPTLESLHSAFYAIRKDMDGCVEKMPKAIPIWNVVTGDGRIALASVKSEDITEAQRGCLENKLKQGALKYRDKMPRFRACFRNFTYPVVFRE